jgi:hypothetical protein
MIHATMVQSIHDKFTVMSPELDERSRRLWAASEALSLPYGGITAVAQATGLAVSTIRIGLRELRSGTQQRLTDRIPAIRRIRSQGGGRKELIHNDPALLRDLEVLVESTTRGDPMSVLRWTCKSTRNLAVELCKHGHSVSHMTVTHLLHEMGYSLQGNQKTLEGVSHPDRNAQFEYINTRVKTFQKCGQPVISVDTKKKELVGDFKNGGREWHPEGNPTKVRVHDFENKELGKVAPYGVYDMTENAGWVSVGTDHDTAEFAVQSIRQWWRQMGSHVYPNATELLITADSGGSNGSRVRLWKVALQRLSDETGLRISVCHLPPGTSKWNTIEHRMFCHITRNWRGRPLESHEVIVNLIGSTTTEKGLRIHAALDKGRYEKGIKVTDKELAEVRLEKDSFHGEWNYAISSRK